MLNIVTLPTDRPGQSPTITTLGTLQIQLKSTIHPNGILRKLPIKTALEMNKTLTFNLYIVMVSDPNATDLWNIGHWV